ncbi:MAG TPA: hypothetical protein VGM64_08035 [Lacunisphaera sp.]|jgi:hypothetical protein
MKNLPLLSILACSAVTFATVGCTTPDIANTKKNRDDVARMKEESQGYEKKGGNLSGDYLADLMLNGSGKKSNKPVFDQPRGGDKSP